ncbi:MAG: hypothetical protein IJJ69_08145, partial [Oscillospiraceae bacterium]|nr:hypothetical protein [Oscillospiraceae bacterium]
EHGYLETESTDIASDWDDTEFEELPETEIMSAEYTKAVRLNNHIKAHAQIAQESLYEVCKGLKEMRDNKLYKELGYQNFEEYCEKEVGIKRHQAMKYAKIAELENVDSTQHLGTEKLYLLAKLDEPQREEIQQSTDLNQTSVRELKEKIKTLEDKSTQQKEELQKVSQERDEKEQARAFLANAYKKLLSQVEELKKKPTETVTVEDTTKIEELEAKLKETQSLLDEKEKELAELSVVQAPLLDEDNWQADEREFNALLKPLKDALSHTTAFIAKISKKNRFDVKYKVEAVQKLIRSYTDVMNENANRKE